MTKTVCPCHFEYTMRNNETKKLIQVADFTQIQSHLDDEDNDNNSDDLYTSLQKMHKYRNEYDSSGSGYEHSSDDKGLEPLDINLIENGNKKSFSRIKTPYPPTPFTPMPIETPFMKCAAAFWNLFKHVAILLATLWIIFMFFILMQSSMSNIREIISYIDPISARNHPVAHRVHSKDSCSEYNFTKFSQFGFVFFCIHPFE